LRLAEARHKMETEPNINNPDSKEITDYNVGDNTFTLAQTPFKNTQLLHILQRTNPKYIYQRKGPDGTMLDYVPGGYMKKALNYLFGWMWSTKVIDSGNIEVKGKPVEVWVDVELTIKLYSHGQVVDAITKTQTGGAKIKYYKSRPDTPVSYANDRKAAITDAVKKCAAELGIASDVYNRNEFREIKSEVVEQVKVKESSRPMLEQLRKLLIALGAKTEAEMKNLIMKHTNVNVISVNRISEQRAEMLINYLFKKKPDAKTN
jgi:recombination DNA repair RAD52 pathway protein